MKMIVHHGAPADPDREDSRKLLDPVFDPLFSVGRAFSSQQRAPDAPARASNDEKPNVYEELMAQIIKKGRADGIQLPMLPYFRITATMLTTRN